MYDSAKDRFTESFKFKEDDNGSWLKNSKGDYDFISCGRHANPCYIKGGEKKRPIWCKDKFGKNTKDNDMTPNPDCYQCPYLALADVEREEYQVMVRAWDKASKEGKFDHLEDRKTPPLRYHAKKKSKT